MEFDVIPLDLAENARNLRYYLLLQCLGPEELRKRSDSDLEKLREQLSDLDLEKLRKQQSDSGLEKLYDQLSRPACTTELPFPFPGKGKPVERFAITDGIYWSYVGREYFTTLLNEVTQFMGSVTRELSLYGTIGYGKSYLLAALVCYLTVNGTRIVYIPDCRECCKDPLNYFLAAMLFTWADNIKAQEAIMKLKSMDDIWDFFQNKRNILFIVDQTNALDVEEKSGDTVCNDRKKDVRKWIDWFTSQHKVIYSASANYQARVRTVQKQTNDKKLYVYGGFSAVSPPNMTL